MKRLSMLLSATAVMIMAASAQWVQTAGPEGGLVVALAVNQSTGHVFAGTKGGIYRSNDGGATWSWLSTGLPAGYGVVSLYTQGSETYVYGAPSQTTYTLYRSTDDGASWTAMAATGLPTLASISCLLVSGADLLAGVSTFFGTPGVYRSTDHGANWTIASTGLPSTFYPGAFGVEGSTIFAGGGISATTKGAYVSTNGGANWTAANTNFPSTAGVTAFATIGTTVFAATLTGGVLKTTDNGANWTKISPTTPLVIGATALAATSTNLFIGGGGAVFKADASGALWDTVTIGLPPRNAGSSLPALAITGSNLLASCSNLGIWRSTNNGASWAKSCSGLKAGNIWGLLTDRSFLYASGVETGFFRSSDNGNSWTEINSGVNLLNNGYYGFAISGSYLVGGSGIGPYRSTDQGNTWSTPSLDYSGPSYSLVVDGTDLYASGQGLVAKSTNNGANWTTLTTGFVSIQAVFAIWKSGLIMLGGTSTGGIKRSTDGGNSWTAPVSGLATTGGFGSFAQIGSTLFVAYSGGVYRSTDDGATWTVANTGVVGGPAALHTVGTDLYVGTNQGVYRSANLGTSWTSVTSGLPVLPVVTRLTSNGQYLFAGLNPNSVWRRPLTDFTAVEPSASDLPGSFRLEQNYPNPFNPTTVISFLLPVASSVRLAVYDLLGHEVALLVNDRKPAGSHTVTFEGSGLASGVYYYRLDAGDFTTIRKMALIK